MERRWKEERNGGNIQLRTTSEGRTEINEREGRSWKGRNQRKRGNEERKRGKAKEEVRKEE